MLPHPQQKQPRRQAFFTVISQVYVSVNLNVGQTRPSPTHLRPIWRYPACCAYISATGTSIFFSHGRFSTKGARDGKTFMATKKEDSGPRSVVGASIESSIDDAKLPRSRHFSALLVVFGILSGRSATGCTWTFAPEASSRAGSQMERRQRC